MPRLWSETIEAHRDAVREATLNTAAALVAERGVRAVTMSQIAAETGIGRATLYKYFPDVEAILVAWHQRQVARHLEHLIELCERTPRTERVAAVLEAYALIQHEHHGSELAALLHDREHVAQAQRHLHSFLAELVRDGAARGELRADVTPDELAAFCLHALGAAPGLPSKAAVRRLVAVTLSGLRASL